MRNAISCRSASCNRGYQDPQRKKIIPQLDWQNCGNPRHNRVFKYLVLEHVGQRKLFIIEVIEKSVRLSKEHYTTIVSITMNLQRFINYQPLHQNICIYTSITITIGQMIKLSQLLEELRTAYYHCFISNS